MPVTTKPNNPTQAQMDGVLTGTGQINTLRQYGAFGGDDIWATGMTVDQFEAMAAFNFMEEDGYDFLHQYSLFFPDRAKPVSTEEFYWYEFDRTRQGVTINASGVLSTTGGTTAEIETTVGDQLLDLNRVVRSARGWTAIVTAVDTTTNASNVRYSLQKMDGSVWTNATDLADGDKIGNVYSAFPEGSSAPNGQKWLPKRYSNRLGIIRASYDYTGSAGSNKIELAIPGGGETFVELDLLLTYKEFCRDYENMLFWGVRSQDAATAVKSSEGILPTIESEAAAPVTYTTFSETVIQSLFSNQNTLNRSGSYLGLGGYGILADVDNGLSDYFVDGGVSYGDFAGNGAAIALGLGVRSYSFLGGTKRLYFKHYKPLDDREVTGYAGAASATVTDYSNYMLLLNMGNSMSASVGGAQFMGTSGPATLQGGGLPYFCTMYKQAGGLNRRFVMGFKAGMTGRAGSFEGQLHNKGNYNPMPAAQTAQVATGDDRDSVYFLSEIGARLISSKYHHTYMRKNG